jgi:hypothetical protein
LWTSPDAPREVDDAAVRDVPDIAAWASNVQTRELVGLTLTQLLLGEGVRVLEGRDGWLKCEVLLQPSGQAAGSPATGYVGWLRRAHVGAPVERAEGAGVVVVSRTASCQTESDDPVELSFGTALWVDGLSETSAHVLLADGRRGSLALRDVHLGHKRQQVKCGTDDLLDLARQFLGLRYVWGGTSAWGLDCSGLVHLTHRALGVVLPRDASDMAADPDVQPVPLDDVRPGDLYFFASPGRPVSHVGLVTRPVGDDGARWMLHAPEAGGFVEEVAMGDERRATLVSAGRVVKPGRHSRAGSPRS